MISVIDPSFNLAFPKAHGDVTITGAFRQTAEDFYVEENLGFSPTGEGEHVCLYIEKKGHNTHWVTSELARFANITDRDVGVCGRKDRHAITRQWFSLYLPLHKADSQELDWSSFLMEGVRILTVTRHSKKLRLGAHETNRFAIRLRSVTNDAGDLLSESDQQLSSERIARVLAAGVPNYYGVQRFGREGGNLSMANDWFIQRQSPPRKQRSMVLSASRSYLFNQVLAHRVQSNTWDTVLNGDVDGAQIPTGALWGRGRLTSGAETLSVEQQVLSEWSEWCGRLEHLGVNQERRDLVLKPQNIALSWSGADLVIAFDLPPGTFATSVLSEVINLDNQAPNAT